MEAAPSDGASSAALGCDSQPVEAGAATDALYLVDTGDLGEEGRERVTASNAVAGLHERLEPEAVMHRVTRRRKPVEQLQRDLAQPLAAQLLADLAHRHLRRESGNLFDRPDRVGQR